MEELTKEEIQVLIETLSERFTQLSEVSRTGVSRKIRETAKQEANDVMAVWQKIEGKQV